MKQKFLALQRLFLSAAVLAVIFLICPNTAQAGKHDIKLSRLCSGDSCGGPESIEQFSGLTKAYASIVAPMHFQPASTLGQEGFEISVDSKISFSVDDNSYWKALNMNANAAPDKDGNYAAPDAFSTIQLQMRKGLPFSLEVEGVFNWLAESEIFYVGAGIRWAFTEGWWFMPDISVRAHVGTLIGAAEINMINVNMDIALSYTWGLGGIASITPYAGYTLLTSWANSRPIVLGNNENGDVFRRVNHHLSHGFVGVQLKGEYFVFDVEGEFGQQVMSLGLKIGAQF